MKCIILLTIVALCHSYPYGTGYGSGYGSWLGSGKNFNVNPDGTITITTANGKMITISKGLGQNVVVDVTNPSGQYFGGYQKYQPTQVDTLAKILSQYQGDVNQDVYQQLLGDVNYAVQQGQLGNGIYEALHKWNQMQQMQGGFGGQLRKQWQQDQIQQLMQQARLQQQGFPYGQTTGQFRMPVGMNQQEQMVEKMMLQSQMGYPYTTRLVSGNQGMFGNQGYGGQWAWNTLMNKVLYGKGQQQTPFLYDQYQVGPIGQVATGQLLQVEGKILNQQNQIHQQQMQQEQQQQQMLNQQFQQQLQQQQMQGKQEYVQELQEVMQKEQQQVLGQQQQVQEQQKYNNLMGLMRGSKTFMQTDDLQTGYGQQPRFYSQRGLYGGYGQGFQQHNIPLVF